DMYLPYLRWRLSWADCTTWDTLTARLDNLAQADTADVNDLLGANLQFIEHLGHYRRWIDDPRCEQRYGTEYTIQGYYPPTWDRGMVDNWARLHQALPALHDPALIGRPLAEHEVPQAARAMFQYQIHDSFAGFRPQGTEATEILEHLEKLSHQDPSTLSPTEREWVEDYQKTKAATGRPQVPKEASKGYEPFLLGGSYLHIRRIYAGSDGDRLARKPPATQFAFKRPGAGVRVPDTLV
ncbi:hypothetical protein, partial [Zoogloea sp.]|uniref:hypothetical protein n=1 Tax=Zoogloea sp. TaxID=49181 RepID=UPI0035AE65D5